MSELSPRVRAIVEAGRSADDPTGEDRARVRGAVLRAIGAGAAHAAIGAASAKAAAAPKGAAPAGISGVGGGGLAAKIGVAISVFALAGAGLGAAVTGRRESPERAADALSSMIPPAFMPELPAALDAPAAPKNEEGSASLRIPAEASARSDRPRASEEDRAGSQQKPGARAHGGAPAKASTLEEETKRLGEAHRAMRSGEPEKALALLEEQSAAFASGDLQEERAAARVFALCEAGKASEAKAAAQAFLHKNPRSPLAGRVRAACAGKESSPAD